MGLTRDKMEFAAVLALHVTSDKANAYQVAALADKLCRYGATYSRLQAAYCNSEIDLADESSFAYKKEKRIEKAILALVSEFGAKVKFGGDPRGCTVKIIAPNCADCGHDAESHVGSSCSLSECPCQEFRRFTNDWGQEGICVPTA